MASRRYSTITEVAERFDVNASLLRYWEKEFDALQPKKQSSGKRGYTARDIEVIAAIHSLVKEQGFTIEGARRKLRMEISRRKREHELLNRLESIRRELMAISEDL